LSGPNSSLTLVPPLRSCIRPRTVEPVEWAHAAGDPASLGTKSWCANKRTARGCQRRATAPTSGALEFLERGHSNVTTGLAMAGLIVALDLVWYSVLALAVTRLRRLFVDGPWQHRLERVTGSVMVGLGLRLGLESR
jgi:hypothetical protein